MPDAHKSTAAEVLAAIALALSTISLLASLACYAKMREIHSAAVDMERAWQDLRRAVTRERG